MNRPSEPTMSVGLMWPFQRAYNDLGLGADILAEAIERYALQPAQLADPATRVPVRLVYAALEENIIRRGRPDIGLLAGLAARRGDFGDLELAARACSTVGDALSLTADGYQLVIEGMYMAVERRGDAAVLRLWSDAGLRIPPASVEFAMLSLLRASMEYADGVPYPERVRFSHPAVPYAAACAAAFRCPVEFDAVENALEWRWAVAQLPLQSANRASTRPPRPHVAVVGAGRIRRDDFVRRVQRLVTQRIANGIPGFESVARTLGLSERTLHRKLKDAGTSYREICDDVRVRLAAHYLVLTRWSLKQIASALGFGDVHAFHRAFKRGAGTTPKRYRVTHKQVTPPTTVATDAEAPVTAPESKSGAAGVPSPEPTAAPTHELVRERR